jgi:sodium/potassium-transporting ATPase subunit alpha
MVTGDHPITAAAIARQIGLITRPTRSDIASRNGIDVKDVNESEVGAVVIHGHQINDMTDADWSVVLSKPDIVFARTSPEQKLIIVKKFTAAGYLTSMTGDGVNDSPALKQASIGIAMGKNGSDVAREASDIILLDDNFASIVVGIKEGRLLFANLKKSIAYTLAHTMPEVTDALAFILFTYPLPTTAILLLCIDLLTELLPAMSLAYESPESDIMRMKPRVVHEDRLISFPLLGYSYFQAGAMISVACFFSYFLAFYSYGITMAEIASFGN